MIVTSCKRGIPDAFETDLRSLRVPAEDPYAMHLVYSRALTIKQSLLLAEI